jgi:hypothetical protein
MGMEIPFLTKYQNIKTYLVDFFVITEKLLDFCTKSLGNENYSIENVNLFNF